MNVSFVRHGQTDWNVAHRIQSGGAAEVDLNVVMTDDGRYVELQGTAERNPFTEESLDALRALARKGLRRIFKLMQ